MKNKFIQFFCALLLVGSIPAKEMERIPVKDIRDVVTSVEFDRAGLGKLSRGELLQLSGALYGWKEIKPSEPEMTVGHQKVTVRQEKAFGKETLQPKKANKNDPKKITSRIVGDFNGWKGNTVFRLSNGQVWRQTEASNFFRSGNESRS